MIDLEADVTRMPLKEKPSILLWATEIDHLVHLDHIIWFEPNELGQPVLKYGYLSKDGLDRTCLVQYDGHSYRDELPERMYTLRCQTTLRWLWHQCIFTNDPYKRYRWYRFPEELDEALELHRNIYGVARSKRYLYGKNT